MPWLVVIVGDSATLTSACGPLSWYYLQISLTTLMTKNHCFRVKEKPDASTNIPSSGESVLTSQITSDSRYLLTEPARQCRPVLMVCVNMSFSIPSISKSCKKKANVFLVQSLLYNRHLIFSKWMIWAFKILAYRLFCPPHSGLRRDANICSQLVRLPESHFLADEFMPLQSCQHSPSFDVEPCSFTWHDIVFERWLKWRKENTVVLGNLLKSLRNLPDIKM